MKVNNEALINTRQSRVEIDRKRERQRNRKDRLANLQRKVKVYFIKHP